MKLRRKKMEVFLHSRGREDVHAVSTAKTAKTNHSAAFKAKVCRRSFARNRMPAELAQQLDVHANQIGKWKCQLLEPARDVFWISTKTRSMTGRT